MKGLAQCHMTGKLGSLRWKPDLLTPDPGQVERDLDLSYTHDIREKGEALW